MPNESESAPSVRIFEAQDQAALEACFAIRRQVFCIEQAVPPSLEWDGLDEKCVHLLATRAGQPIGTARLRVYVPGIGKVERVAVLKHERRQGIGQALMAAALAHFTAQGFLEIVLNAQLTVRLFYESLGYTSVGAPFEEAGIPHIRMRRVLR